MHDRALLKTVEDASPPPVADQKVTCRAVVHQDSGTQARSKLKLLVPSVGTFFTPLLLKDAFLYQDERRRISYRRFVPPSFNDIRL
jgi:IMP-specific 5'-nucleotidase